ncbi:hypothetical protein LR48_Vigan11g111900 [Vigna angularis]|uniref:Uncharacterized protein n=1 Tax=Phaseolus angularis TaxID=3914 RepID=A0A0L9VSP0_PHAAN|nr:hypothetical protein LR48_Vigan11g111900 [Vigna angularis]
MNPRGGAAATTSRERKMCQSFRSRLPSYKSEPTLRSEKESSLHAKQEPELEKRKRRFASLTTRRNKTRRKEKDEDGCFPLLVKPRQRSEEENKTLAERTPRARESNNAI